MQAMNDLNSSELEGSCLEVTLAKSVDKEQYSRSQKAAKGGGVAEAAAQPRSVLARPLGARLLWYLTTGPTGAAS